jgi:cyanophycin synthetase
VRLADTSPGEIIFISLDEQNPVIGDHLLEGGRTVVLRQTPAGETLSLRVGMEESTLLPVGEIPTPIGGNMHMNIQNALAAAAAAIGQNVPLADIRAALRTFASSDV